MKTCVAAVGVALLAALATAAPARACSCAVDPDAKQTLHNYDAAATARLIDVKNKDPQTGSADLVYRLLRVYKNKNLREGETLVIKGSGGGGTCGLPRNKKERYGLRLTRFRGELEGSSCSVLSPKELRRAAERSGNARSGGSIGCGGTAA